jgi:hypothetical protein
MIMGKTGSGKTEYMKWFLRRVSEKMPVVIIDPKFFWLGDNPVWATEKEIGTVDKPHLVKRFNPKLRVQVYQSRHYDAGLDRFLKAVFKHKNIYVYIDENAGIATATSIGEGLDMIWRMGRSMGIGAADGSQTFRRIPDIFKSQAEKFILFKVGRGDAKDAATLVNVEEEDVRSLGKYEYIFYDNQEMDYGEWMPPLDLEAEKERVGAA